MREYFFMCKLFHHEANMTHNLIETNVCFIASEKLVFQLNIFYPNCIQLKSTDNQKIQYLSSFKGCSQEAFGCATMFSDLRKLK